MAKGSSKQWSTDQQFIEEFTILRRWFLDSGITENVYGMIKSLKYLAIVCEPKLLKKKPQEEMSRIKWAEDNVHMIHAYNREGKIMDTDNTLANKKQIITWLDDTYRSLIKKLDSQGVYTKFIEESRESLGDMGGS